MEDSMEIPQKVKNKIIIWSSNSTSGYLSKENRNTTMKRYTHYHIHCSTIYNSQDREKPQYLLLDEWIKKLWYMYIYIYTHMCVMYIWNIIIIYIILFSHKKEWHLTICDNMDRPWGPYVKWNKSERQIQYDLSYMQIKKKQQLIDTENRLVIARCGSQWVGEMGHRVRG